mmetsp:Transcript_10149/g.35705  ORF Transcript_10149/g.35705 Transcript_10149/m.35705 type:complete len:193 (-) Transcript_10149:8-586(-)
MSHEADRSGIGSQEDGRGRDVRLLVTQTLTVSLAAVFKVPASTRAPCKCRHGTLRSSRRVEAGARALYIRGGLRLQISRDAHAPIRALRAGAFDGLQEFIVKLWFEGTRAGRTRLTTSLRDLTNLRELVLVHHRIGCCGLADLPDDLRCCAIRRVNELKGSTIEPFKYGHCIRTCKRHPVAAAVTLSFYLHP